MKNKILVLGWYNKNNCGDESYKISFPQLFLSSDFVFTDTVKNIDLSEFDTLILGGGNVLQTSFINEIQKCKNQFKKIYALSVGVTSEINPNLLNIFDKIVVRDIRSLNLLKKHNIPADFCPDLAFALKPNFDQVNLTIEQPYDAKIGIVLNAHLIGSNSKEFTQFLYFARVIAEVLDSIPANFIFIPFGKKLPYDDRVTNSWIAHFCKYWKKNTIVYDNLSVIETLNLINQMDMMISTRLHSTIFSCICGKPFVDITHHDKNFGFLETINQMNSSLFYWDLSPNLLIKKIEPIMSDIKFYAQQIHTVKQEQYSLLTSFIQSL